ncbi:hypothetical protein [Salinibacter altiplanensis]|uniref:hypothetical protein n=1 Tax=Salinibacter altiplanensis TaxID=1803181 RepID=UPI00131A5DFA|nr:hypothetical protein [Salinibacter altiplanensis]
MPDPEFPIGEPFGEDEPQETGGAARVPLSEAITVVLDVLTQCGENLEAIRHRLRQEELPEELDIDESELPQPDEQVRHVAVRLETCAGALGNASGEVRNQAGLPPGE